MNTHPNTLIVIVGPTAVGKTATAIRLAQHFGAEIISADSRQLYRELTIGTAKPDAHELAAVPHHFINSHSIQQSYDAASFGRDALARITKLFEQHPYVVLCGGSGLYVKAVLEGFDDIPEVPDVIREELVSNFETYGLVWLQEKMQTLDPDHLATIDVQNPNRLMRALEVKIGTGNSIASYRKQSKLQHDFAIIKIGLTLPREVLYQRIDTRMDTMINAGLFEEAQQLYPYKSHNALQTVGYQEIFDYIDGGYDREEAIRLLKRNSRRYAKRQLTWFKRDEEIHWVSPDVLPEMIDLINHAAR